MISKISNAGHIEHLARPASSQCTSLAVISQLEYPYVSILAGCRNEVVAPIIVQKSILSDNVLLGSHPKKPATLGNIPAHIGCPADIMDYSSVSTQNFACLPLVVVVLSKDLIPLQEQKSLLVIAVVKVSMLGTTRLKHISKPTLATWSLAHPTTIIWAVNLEVHQDKQWFPSSSLLGPSPTGKESIMVQWTKLVTSMAS